MIQALIFWIDLNEYISKWIHQGEKIILNGDCNSEASEVNICMETHGLTNKICNIHRYSNAPITYQPSEEFPINRTCSSASLMENR